MFKIQKTMEISGSHQLNLDYDSACKQLHGHNWFVTVYVKADNVNKEDFYEKAVISGEELAKGVTNLYYLPKK